MPDQYEVFEKLIQAGKFKEAEQGLFAWLRDNPNDSRAWMLYGKSVTSQHQKRVCFQRALTLDPSNSEAEALLREIDPVVSPAPQNNSPSIKDQNVRPLPIQSPPETKSHKKPPTSKPLPSSDRSKTRLTIVVYSFIHFFVTIILGTVLIFFLSSLVPGVLQNYRSTDTIQRGWISNSTASGADQQLQSLANIFLNPYSLNYKSVSKYKNLRLLGNSISETTSKSKPIQFTGVRFMGQLVGGSILQNGNDGQPLVIEMEVEFDGNQIPVVYYGPVGNFQYGDILLIEGVYISDVNGVVAQQIQRQISNVSTQPDQNTLKMLRLAVAALLWALFCISFFLWRLNLRKWNSTKIMMISPAAILLCLLPITLIMAGCSMNLSTTLRADGTGITTILVQESRENMDFLRSAPSVSEYLSALVRDIKGSGALFDQYIQGDQEFILIQRNINISNGESGNIYPIEGSWVTVQRYTEGNEQVIRFLGVVDTRVLYSDSPGISSDVANALRDQLNQISMTYHLNVPGQIVYHNGEETTNQNITWHLKMNGSNYLVAETRFTVEGKNTSSYIWYIWIAIGIIFFIATLFLIAGFTVPFSSNRLERRV